MWRAQTVVAQIARSFSVSRAFVQSFNADKLFRYPQQDEIAQTSEGVLRTFELKRSCEQGWWFGSHSCISVAFSHSRTRGGGQRDASRSRAEGAVDRTVR